MPPFQKHIFICTNERTTGHPRGCCQSKGAPDLIPLFKEEIKKRGLQDKVRANKSGCLDLCEKGPTVVVYPEGVWYRVNTPQDVIKIMDEHIENNRPVTELISNA